MIKVINDENVWDAHSYIIGDARNVNGCMSGLYGCITGFSGCCSNIAGDLNTISKITRDLDKLQELTKKHNAIKFCIHSTALYRAVIGYCLIIDGKYRIFQSFIKISELSLERLDDIIKNKS